MKLMQISIFFIEEVCVTNFVLARICRWNCLFVLKIKIYKYITGYVYDKILRVHD